VQERGSPPSKRLSKEVKNRGWREWGFQLEDPRSEKGGNAKKNREDGRSDCG